MAVLLFANRASSTLQSPISAGTTSVTLAPGTAARFPNPAAGEYFIGTFIDAATGLLNEIVNVTAVVGDVLTIVRGQESTTARSWNAGDLFYNFWTAGSAATMLQQGQQQQQSTNYAVDSGTTNALVIALTPVPASMTELVGAAIRVNVAHTTTSTTPTLNVNGLGAFTITYPSITALAVGALTAGGIAEVVWDGTRFQYTNQIIPATTAQIQAGTDVIRPVTAAALAGALATSHTDPGYQKFPNGTIVQWGSGSTSSGIGDFTNFPVTFPTRGVVAVAVGSSSQTGGVIYLINANPSPGYAGFKVWTWQTLTGTNFAIQGGVVFNWIAIGY